MKIDELRARIDRIDSAILALLNRRMRVARGIGRLKQANGGTIYAPNREAQIFDRLLKANKGPLSGEALRAIYTEIISACRASEEMLRVAFLGPDGTFSHQAVRRVFGTRVEYVPTTAIDQVFSEVEAGHADYGVVPVENSTEGGVAATLNGLIEADLKICAEIYLRIHHNLLIRNDTVRVQRIYSKAEVFGQCRSWLAAHYPNAQCIATSSTSEAAERAARRPGSGAIAHLEMARRHGLKMLHRAIEDSSFNTTRFLVLSRNLVGPSGNDKTSILCFVRDEIGALAGILNPMKNLGVNLTKVESWPSRRKPWDYCFFIDFLGHYEDPNIARALARVSRRCKEMKLLGSYPAAGAG